MKLRKLGVGALALAAGIGMTGFVPVAADAPNPTISFQGVVVSDGVTAWVHIAYTCTSTVSPANHLFVAVKQGPDVSPDNSSSETAHLTTFLSTNWSVDAGPNALVCNGKTQHQTIVVKPQIDFLTGEPLPMDALKSGQVLVQLCIFDNITDPNAFPGGGFNLDYTMQRAVVNGSAGHRH